MKKSIFMNFISHALLKNGKHFISFNSFVGEMSNNEF